MSEQAPRSATSPPPAGPLWHALASEEVERRLATQHAQGLSAAEAAARLRQYGRNRLREHPGKALWRRFLDQLTPPLVLVLIVSGTITALLGEWLDASVIFGVVLVNAILGVSQERQAEGALAALARSVAHSIVVLRDGQRQRIAAEELTPGDVVCLAAGDRVPADLRLFRSRELMVDESALTGESAPVAKSCAALAADTILAERSNMSYAGTAVVAGQGFGFVVAIGDASETGRIADLIARAPDLSTPLARKMAAFANTMLWVIAGLALLTVLVGLWRGESAYAMFMAAVALSVGAIPEGLPAAVTITLAIGVGRMAKRRAIIRHLPAVETLGGTTTICSDKTGTLTENAMTVRAYWCAGTEHAVDGQGYNPAGHIGGAANTALHACLSIGALCNDASLQQDARGLWQITGDPTEAALIVAARKGGFDEAALHRSAPRLDELPFDADRQYMATLHELVGERIVLAKGALERLLPRCTGMLDAAGQVVALDHAAIEAATGQLAARGLRVLALARRNWPSEALLHDKALHGLCFVGLVGMIDPPRTEAIAAIADCQRAGIRVKMITGDHASTAAAIAAQIGLAADRVVSGRELAGMDGESMAAAVRQAEVFARIEPAQKLQLVQALQAQGEVVAMTGDGVNDAPALKSADIGIAMGRGGTDVAREAAAMVLTDDNFASIKAAVEEGRAVWDNLVKFIVWTLPTNFGEGLVIVVAILCGVTLPITPLQILWINMSTAVLLGLMLAFEPIEAGIMQRPPRHPDTPILDRVLLRRITLVATLLLAGAFGLFLLELERGHSLAEARTVAVNVFVAGEAAYLFNCRSLRHGFWQQAPFSNLWLWGGLLLMAALQLLLTYWPPFATPFQMTPLGAGQWGEILLVALGIFACIEVEKAWSRRTRM